MKRLAMFIFACVALSAQSSATWTKYTVPGSCSDTATPPCYWPMGQGFTSIVPDPVNGGVLIYADRQAFSGTVTVSGTHVNWVSGDQFSTTWGLSATGTDQITINGTAYYIVQNSATATTLTISTPASNGTFTYKAGGAGSAVITASTDFYDWKPSIHAFGPVFPGGNGTLNQSSSKMLLDSQTSSWPADRQQDQTEFYDSSRGAVWLTGGVQASRFWNCSTNGTTNCNTGAGTNNTTWRMNLSTKVWTAVPQTHAPIAGQAYQTSQIDTTDQLVLQVGWDNAATFRTAVYCPTDKNPTPGTLTAHQIAAGCSNGADDWTPNVTLGGGSLTMPLLLTPNLFFSATTGLFYLFGGGLNTQAWNTNIYTYNPLTRVWARVGNGGGCPVTVSSSSWTQTPAVGWAQLANGNFFYHYFPLNSSDGNPRDWIYNPSTDTCTQITTVGGGPSYSDSSAWGTSIAQDPVTGNIVAWSQGGNYVWEATLSSTGSISASGSTMQSGSGAPANTVGNNGDLYYRTDVPAVYGPKTGGVWPSTYSYIVGQGCTTVYHIDKDCDGYGIGPTTITNDPNPLLGPDADDADATVNTPASVLAKYGSINAFLTHLGYPTNRVFYIDAVNGNDASGCGTVSAPCQHYSYSIGTALHDGAGGTVLYRAGTSAGIQVCTAGACYYPAATSSSSPVVIMAYPGEAVKFLAASSPIDGGGGGYNAASNVIFSGFNIISNNPGYGNGIAGSWLQGITFQNMEFAGWLDGIELSAGSQNVTVTNNLFHDIAAHAIYPVSADQNTSKSVWSATNYNCSTWVWQPNNTKYNPHFNFNTTNNIMLYVGSGGFDAVHYNGAMCGGSITGNILVDGGGTAITLQDGNQNVTISNNLIANNSSAGITLNVYGCDNNGSASTAGQVGTSCDPSQSGYAAGTAYYPNMENGNKILNNTIWTGVNGPNFTHFCQSCYPGSYDITVADTSEGLPGNRWIKNTTIQNNLLVSFNGSQGGAFPQLNFARNSYPETDILANNLFWNAYGNNSSAQVMHIDSNSSACSSAPWYCGGSTVGVYGSGSSYPGDYSFSQLQSYNTTSNTNEVWGNPLFADVSTSYYNNPGAFNFRVTAGSPAVGAGRAAGAPQYDITGKLRPAAPSIGAYELTAGTPRLSVNACDLNTDGVVNALDVQIAVNQAIGTAPCANADLIGNGTCSVVDVQRVINASLGGSCRTGQ